MLRPIIHVYNWHEVYVLKDLKAEEDGFSNLLGYRPDDQRQQQRMGSVRPTVPDSLLVTSGSSNATGLAEGTVLAVDG